MGSKLQRVLEFSIVMIKQNYNLACCFVWVWILVADIEGGKEAEGVWEYGVEENIWTEEGGNGGDCITRS